LRGAEHLDLALLEVGVDFDLVDGGDHCRGVQQPGEVVDHEVTDPDGADLAVSQQCLERAVGLQGLVEV